MGFLRIVKYPEPELRLQSQAVDTPASPQVRQLVEDMVETMYANNGAGLAAIQVGQPHQLFIVDGQVASGSDKDPPLVFINPTVEPVGDETETSDEGCLSFPGVYVPIRRHRYVRIRAVDLEGKAFTVEAEGLYARALQHETDHLTGHLIVDFVGAVKRGMIKRKMRRLAQEEADDAEPDGPPTL